MPLYKTLDENEFFSTQRNSICRWVSRTYKSRSSRITNATTKERKGHKVSKVLTDSAQKSRLVQFVTAVPCLSFADSPCKAELSSINKKQAGKKLLGETDTLTLKHTHTHTQRQNDKCVRSNSLCASVCCLRAGQYLPSCDEEGYYRSHQCHSSSGQCWCVDRYGNEVSGSRTHGPANCGRQKSQGGQGVIFLCSCEGTKEIRS